MAEPQIRYVQSADGTRIATTSFGEGRPLVILSVPFTTIELRWQIPEIRENLEHLAERRKVVLHDSRGSGLSSRDVTDFSLDARVADLEAVAASVDPAEVDLLSPGFRTGAAAIAYAARHPEKMRRLALASPTARMGVLTDRPIDRRLASIEPLADVDWELYLQCRSLVMFGWTDLARRSAELRAREVSHEVHLMFNQATDQDDVMSLLPLVRCPTLVMFSRGDRPALSDSGPVQEVAAAIPNALLVPHQQDHVMLLGAAWDSSLRIVADFLDEDEVTPAQEQLPSGTAIILFADIVDSTALAEQLGNAAFRERARALEERVRERIAAHAGTAVDGRTLGDGVLATFASASDAIATAVDCAQVGEDVGLALHLGLHAGDVMREGGNVHGQAVSIASRVSDLSAPNEVLVSGTVRDLARASAGVTFEDRGERELKGVGEPVRVFAVRSE